MRSLPRIVAETPIDKEVTLKYWREGKEHKAKVSIGELEKAEDDGLLATNEPSTPKPQQDDKGTLLEEFGMTLSPLSPQTRERYDIPESVKGVAVIQSDPRGKAAEKGILAGDVIVEINQTPMSTPQDVQKK